MPRSPRDLSEIIAEIHAAPLDVTGVAWSRLCERLAHLVAADGSVALGLQRGRCAYAASHAFGLDADSLLRYQAYYREVDPVFEPRLPGAAPGTILLSDALMQPGELRRTEFDADWLRPHGFGAGLATVLVRHGSAQSALYVARPRRRGAFSRAELELLQLLLPHLAGAVRTSLRLAELANERDAFGDVLDRWTQAVLLVDAQGRVRSANRAAEALLRTMDGLTVERSPGAERGRLRAATPATTIALHRLIQVAARHAAPGRGDVGAGVLAGPMTVVLERPSGRPALAALLAPLAARGHAGVAPFAGLQPDGVAALVAIFIADPAGGEAPGPSVSALLRAAYRLTPSETEVAVALADGRGLRAVAAAQGVTLATIRTQAQQVYRKAHVRGQAALARLVGRLAHVR